MNIAIVSAYLIVYGKWNLRSLSGINCCTRCGSSPSHCGFWAVPSKFDVVLNGSNSPRAAASDIYLLSSGLLRGQGSRMTEKSSPLVRFLRHCLLSNTKVDRQTHLRAL